MVLSALDKSVVHFDSSRSLFVSIVYRYEIYMPKLKKKPENTQHGYFSYSKYDRPRRTGPLVDIGICTSKQNEEMNINDREFMLLQTVYLEQIHVTIQV